MRIISDHQLQISCLGLVATAGMVVSLVSPYLQQEPVNMGGKIGFIWGGVSAITLVWVFWFVPELKVRHECNGHP